MSLEPIQYEWKETPNGVWRTYRHDDGKWFKEFISRGSVTGIPWLHYTYGKNPETKKHVTAKGIIGIGKYSMGVIAIGQFCFGFIAIGQFALGLLLGLGQFTTGLVAFGQLALSVFFAIGQGVTGYVCVGQFGYGHYVLAQFGLGDEVWDIRGVTKAAKDFFTPFVPW